MPPLKMNQTEFNSSMKLCIKLSSTKVKQSSWKTFLRYRIIFVKVSFSSQHDSLCQLEGINSTIKNFLLSDSYLFSKCFFFRLGLIDKNEKGSSKSEMTTQLIYHKLHLWTFFEFQNLIAYIMLDNFVGRIARVEQRIANYHFARKIR